MVHPNLIKQIRKYVPILIAVSGLSKDRSTGVGAIALSDSFSILSTGRNGFPRGVNDEAEERHDRPAKYMWTSHAEENLVAQAARDGVCLKNSTVMVYPLSPCACCARMLIQAGVTTVIAVDSDLHNPRWKDQQEVASQMFKEAGVVFLTHDTT